MATALRRARKPFALLSKWRFNFDGAVAAASFSNRRSFSDSSNTDCADADDGTVADSSEFIRWHNGGGMFHRSACIKSTAFVEIGAVVHANSVLGECVHIASGAIVGPSVSVGQSTRIGTHYSVRIFIRNERFGFFVDDEGRIVKKPQMLHVRIGDHVEVGANTCIDRGSWRETVVGDHTKIDNLVQIGHNVMIGKCCIICGQVGIAGSAMIGDYVTLGGRVGVKDHVSVSSKVRLAANSLVTKDIVEPGDYGGFPAVPINEWRRQCANLRIFSKKDPSRR